jgi:integrase
MPKRATGHVRWVNGVAVARISVTATKRESLPMPTCTNDAEARERSELLATIAKKLRATAVAQDLVMKVLGVVASSPARSLGSALRMVDDVAGGRIAPTNVSRAPTFQQIGEEWTSGKLAARYPDRIRVKRSAEDDESRLRIHIYPVIGSIPIDRITLDLCEDVMRRLPSTMAVATRRNVGQLIMRILTMAVLPLRLIKESPIPTGFLPLAPKQKALAYLYPDEDRRLMACIGVPLAYRLLWGFLDREGMREAEALKLTWADLDLERGAVRLDKNKTDEPRAWALDAGVAEALRRYRDRYHPSPEPSARVFVDPQGRPVLGGKLKLPAMLRAHLVEVGLHRERPELFTTTAERHQMRVHDLRGTFVTVSLMNGKSESWISDRTGHKSSQMINRYKRTARTFAELQTGELEPLFRAIPELSSWDMRGSQLPPTATTTANYSQSLASPAGFETPPSASEARETTGFPSEAPGARSPSSPLVAAGGESVAVADPVEAALADAITKAAAAGAWAAVEGLSRELAARREARAGVVDLAAARKRRGGGGSAL